ncbi:MAG TPA: transaldolase family protein [Planctomycetota bacterium]|nr:transaldolase family protein [Planctomycetota bacterium]
MNKPRTVAKVLPHDSTAAKQIAAFCLEGHAPPGKDVRAALPSSPLWAAVARCGTQLWLDTGDVDAIAELWTREFTALTTNNTLLNKEVQKGIYDATVPEAAKLVRQALPGVAEVQLVHEIAFILNAVHGLKLVRTFDADVSVELHTDLAHDAEASWQFGRRYHAICPDRFIVKVPLTPAGLFAARRLAQDGVRVNFTLGFSARQNWLIALVARPTWVNVFMGRLNSFVADRGLGDGENVGEKATLASQRLMREVNATHGLQTKQIGASIRTGRQIADLAGLDTLTIPTGAAAEFLQLGIEPASIADRTQDDPKVTFKPGFDPAREGLDVLWSAEGRTREALTALARENLDAMDADALRTFLRDHGVPGLFPELSDDDLAAIVKDGKIPVYERWAERARNGTADWDGLFTESALQSFAVDQKALDERVRGLV